VFVKPQLLSDYLCLRLFTFAGTNCYVAVDQVLTNLQKYPCKKNQAKKLPVVQRCIFSYVVVNNVPVDQVMADAIKIATMYCPDCSQLCAAMCCNLLPHMF